MSVNLTTRTALAQSFVTGVGLITSTGPHGDNVMSAEWTHQISYEPGMIAICLNPGRATSENILAMKEFGVNIVATDQNVFASIAGNNRGKEVDKVSALKELGYQFLPGTVIKAPMVAGARMRVECTLVEHHVYGDHVMYIGEAQHVEVDETKEPIAYSKGKYWKFGDQIIKPAEEELARIKVVVEKHRKA